MPRDADEVSFGLPRNFMRPCLLLFIAQQPSHGYDLLERLRELGYRQIDAGGLYRSLRAMEQESLVESTWQPSESGPPRRIYQLTEDGADWLHAWAGALRETHRIIGLFLARYDALGVVVSTREQTRSTR